MGTRKFLGVFNSESFSKQDALEFYFKSVQRFRKVRTKDVEHIFFDSNFNCTYCAELNHFCDFYITTLDVKRNIVLKQFLEHLKETELTAEKYLVKLVGTKFPSKKKFESYDRSVSKNFSCKVRVLPPRRTRTRRRVVRLDQTSSNLSAGGRYAEVYQPDTNNANQRCLRESTKKQKFRQEIKRPPNDPNGAGNSKKGRIQRPQSPAKSQPIIYNGPPIKDFTIKIRPIEQILKKGNGKFMNSVLLDKMFSQARIDASLFAESDRPIETMESEKVDNIQTECSSNADQMHDSPAVSNEQCPFIDSSATPITNLMNEFHPLATRRIFVSDLNGTTTIPEIRGFFRQFGETLSVRLESGKLGMVDTTIEFFNISSAVKAVNILNSKKGVTLKLCAPEPTTCILLHCVEKSIDTKVLQKECSVYGKYRDFAEDNAGNCLVRYDKLEEAISTLTYMKGIYEHRTEVHIDYASEKWIKRFNQNRSNCDSERRPASTHCFASVAGVRSPVTMKNQEQNRNLLKSEIITPPRTSSPISKDSAEHSPVSTDRTEIDFEVPSFFGGAEEEDSLNCSLASISTSDLFFCKTDETGDQIPELLLEQLELAPD